MKTFPAIITAVSVFILISFISALFFLRPKTSLITINGESFSVRVADNPVTQYRGLSGLTPETLHADGMAFVFARAEERTFIMRDMRFALDFVWVQDGRIVAIDENIPAPQSGESPKTVSSTPLLVDTVLEFPAGFIKKHGILVGVSAEMNKK